MIRLIYADGSNVFPNRQYFEATTTTENYKEWVQNNWNIFPAYPVSYKLTAGSTYYINIYKSFTDYGVVEVFYYSNNATIYARKYGGTWYWSV